MRVLRKILLPLSWIYGGIILIRNFCYDRGWFSSTTFDLPIICIGNLRVGGTGKTPMTEYITRFLKPDYRLALLSRGYKRKSKGFLLAGPETGVADLGDEPFQFFRKFPDVAVAVDANRVEGIKSLRTTIDPEVVLLDDAFQHRKVKAGLYVLLTAYGDLYVHDTVLPSGNLRDTKNQASRADVVVVTKCPQDLSEQGMNRIGSALGLSPRQLLCFAGIEYSEYLYDQDGKTLELDAVPENATLVTGIATPGPLLEYLNARGISYQHKAFPDHHNFSKQEIEGLRNAAFVFTTEKDFVRLEASLEQVYYLPIQMNMIKGEAAFQKKLINTIEAY